MPLAMVFGMKEMGTTACVLFPYRYHRTATYENIKYGLSECHGHVNNVLVPESSKLG